MYRGHKLVRIGTEWRYADTLDLVVWGDGRPCGFCGKHSTPEDHDGCLGTLPGVMNACCGHGPDGHEGAYVQFPDGVCIRDEAAMAFFNEFRKGPDYAKR